LFEGIAEWIVKIKLGNSIIRRQLNFHRIIARISKNDKAVSLDENMVLIYFSHVHAESYADD
jgi:hypothetical protein